MDFLSTTFMKSISMLMLLPPSSSENVSNSQGRNMTLLAGQSKLFRQGYVANRKSYHVVPPECQPNVNTEKLNAGRQWKKAKEPLNRIDISLVEGIGRRMPFVTKVLQRKPRRNIFLLAGQSNMAGQGGVENRRWNHFVPPECQPNPNIQKLNAALQWEEAKEPLHDGIDTRAVEGVGPGMPFANALLKKNPSIGNVGLVPCAISATRILQWQKGQHLYNQLVFRARAAVLSGGTIRALLWYQGESDTGTIADGLAYKGRLQQFIHDIRADLGLPQLLVIVVALASGIGPAFEIVRQAQFNLNLPNVKTVDAKGLQLKRDHLHLTTTSQVILGGKLADAFLT